MNVGRLKCVSSSPGHARRAKLEQQLLAVVAELVHAVSLGVDDPHALLRIVGADLDVVRAREELVPLGPVLGDFALRVDDDDVVFPAAVHARLVVALVFLDRVVAAAAARLAAAADGRRETRGRVRTAESSGSAAVCRILTSSPLLTKKTRFGLSAKTSIACPIRPVLVVRQALRHRLRPVRHGFVRTEDVLPTLQTRYRGEPGAGDLLRLDPLRLHARARSPSGATHNAARTASTRLIIMASAKD